MANGISTSLKLIMLVLYMEQVAYALRLVED